MAQWFPSDASLQASFRAHISSLSSPTPLLGGLVMPRALVGDALTALRPTGLVAPSAPHVHRLAHLASEAAACLGGAEQDREDLPQWVHACVAVAGPPPPPLTVPTPLASSSSSAAAETWLGELRFLELVPGLSPSPSSSSSGPSSGDLSLPPAVAAALPPAISARLRWAVLPVPTPGDKSATRPVDMTHWARLFPAPAQTHSEEDDDEGENDQRGASLASVSPLTPENVAAAASVSFLPGHSFAGSGRFDSTSHASSTESDVIAAEGAAARAALFAIRTLSSSESSQSSAPYTPLPSRFTFIELFSGLGGFRTALAALGGVSVAACDIEPRAREGYIRAHAPGGGVEQVCARVARVCNEGCGGPIHSNAGVNVIDGSGMPLDQLKRAAVAAVDSHKTDDMWSPCPVPALLLPDVTSLPSSLIPPHTILTAGFPCQPFSRLGGQPGTADAVKGTLFQHVMRIAAECKPPVVMLENVPGLVTIDNSRTLLSVLSALTAAGYSGAYKVVDAGGLVPQTRRRIYIIGIRTSLLSHNRPFSFPLCPPPTHRTLAPSFVSLPSLLPAHVVSLVRYHRAVCAPGSPFVTTQRWKLACPQRRAGTLTTGYRRGIGYHSQFVPLSQDEVAQLSPEVAAVLNAPATEAVGDTHTFDDLSKAHALPTAVRWFTERECARLMGFPEAMSLVDLPAERVSALDCAAEETEHHGEAAKRARHAPVGDKDKASSSGTGGAYGLLGNAVCPPTIALLAGSVLAYLHSLASPLPVSECPVASAVEASGGVGAAAAAALAFAAAAPGERDVMMQRLEAAAAAAAAATASE